MIWNMNKIKIEKKSNKLKINIKILYHAEYFIPLWISFFNYTIIETIKKN